MKNKIYYLVLLLVSSFAYAQEYHYTLSAVAIFQNEAEYLKEWIEYHKKVGVEYFLLYNNNSTDHYKEILQEYIEQQVVTLIEWPSIQYENEATHFALEIQPAVYNDAINKLKRKSKWLAIIDTDEFVVAVKSGDVAKLLEEDYSDVSGLSINCLNYGTSNVAYAAGNLLNHLVYRLRWNREGNKFCKCIVQPLHVDHCPNPHYCIYLNGYWAVDSNRHRLIGDAYRHDVIIDKIRINHYWTRDENFLWNVKIPRYQRWGKDIDYIVRYAKSLNEEYDPILVNDENETKKTRPL